MEAVKWEVHRGWHMWTRGYDKSGSEKVIQCNHGIDLTVLPNDKNLFLDLDHPVSSFMNIFCTKGTLNNNAMDKDLWNTLNEIPNFWKNESYREMTINILTAIGANLLLGMEDQFVLDKMDIRNTLELGGITCAIVLLENCCGGCISIARPNRATAIRQRDIFCGGSSVRDIYKFFRKRTSCKCLKKMHLRARKAMPKSGRCYNCNELKERVSLSVCSRCRVHQYCSRECQIADWDDHKHGCGIYCQSS